MRVDEVMTTDVVTAPLEATLAAASETMLRQDVGSVVVTKDGSPAGILTESDVVKAAVVTDTPLSEIPVRRAASSPPKTIAPDATARDAADRMVDLGVKKLVVVDGLDLRGIVTMTDLVRHQNDLVREARALDRKRDGWSG